MVQGYYTLEEAAKILGLGQDELKQMAKRGELRSFQDRGLPRFRTQDIEEMFRQRGGASDPEELPLGEVPAPRSTDSPPRSKAKKEAEVFDFSLDADDAVQIGQEISGDSSSKRRLGGKSDSGKGPASPAPKPGSDSDVRLVADGSDLDFHVASDSDVKIVDDAGPKSMPPGGPKSTPPGSKPPAGQGGKRRTGAHMDSGVRLVSMDSDSDVKIVGADEGEVSLGRQPAKGATDSDIRLEADSGRSKSGLKKGAHEPQLTEEIDLDAEIRKAEEAARKSDPAARIVSPKKKQPEFPTTSPFELSENDLRVTLPPPEAGAGKAAAKAKKKTSESSDDFDLTPGKKKDSSSDFDLTPSEADSSSDFDLTPAGESSSPLEVASDEFQLEVGDESEVGLGDLPAAKGQSGINLKDPADSGISLEQGGEGSDEIEFELSLDAESTPKPAQPAHKADSDVDSDSEFELTIDESGGLAPLEEPAAAAEEKDIFETDFDVPALEDESGSEAMALDDADSDADSSDFDIALDPSDMSSDEESGSQVVAVDEEDAEATIERPKARKKGTVLLEADDDSSGIDELMGGEVEEAEEEEEEMPVAAGRAVAAPAPEWSLFTVVLPMLVCVIIMVLVGMLGFEMVQGVMGYQKPGLLTQKIAKLVNIPIKD